MQPNEAELKAAVDPQILADLVLVTRILYAAWRGRRLWPRPRARDPSGPELLLFSRALAPALVKAEDIMAYDLDSLSGRLIAAARALHPERFIHGEVYRGPGRCAALWSTAHSPTVIPFSIRVRNRSSPVYHMASFIPPEVPVFEIREVAGMTDLLVRNKDLGQALADARSEGIWLR